MHVFVAIGAKACKAIFSSRVQMNIRAEARQNEKLDLFVVGLQPILDASALYPRIIPDQETLRLASLINLSKKATIISASAVPPQAIKRTVP
jgi:hypothetical protein